MLLVRNACEKLLHDLLDEMYAPCVLFSFAMRWCLVRSDNEIIINQIMVAASVGARLDSVEIELAGHWV